MAKLALYKVLCVGSMFNLRRQATHFAAPLCSIGKEVRMPVTYLLIKSS